MIKSIKAILAQDKEKFKVPRKVQDLIPIKNIWPDGIFKVGNKFSKSFRFSDINYLVASREDNGMMSQPFLYTPWRKEHKDLAAIKVGDLVLTPGINMKAIQHFYDAIRKAFFKSEEYNWRWYKFRNRSEYVTYLRKHEEAE